MVVVVAVAGAITVGHEDDHVYDHHRSPRLDARLDHGKESSSEAVSPFRLALAGLRELVRGSSPPPYLG